jgi:hypothetical protein
LPEYEAEPANSFWLNGKGGDDVSWAEMNLIGPKNEEYPHGRLSCYKWTVKISSNKELIYFLKKTYASEI